MSDYQISDRGNRTVIPQEHGLPIPGWMAPENRTELARIIVEYDIRHVIEIGSFLGLSAVWFAQRVTSVTCIDQWYEGANYDSDNNLVGTLRRWELPRDFFYLFRENVMRSGLWHKIHPVRGHSHYVHGEVGDADLIYIDGDHSFDAVMEDIRVYTPKARRIICGDDYVDREGFGVIRAVNRSLPKRQVSGAFWWTETGPAA